ncbi:MAG: thioredoxin family protein [Arenicellales bacterium]
MVDTPSTMPELGNMAPDFRLPNTNPDFGGDTVGLDDYDGKKGLLVMFICNHCPFVKRIREGLAQLGRDYERKDLGIVAICANDQDTYPNDGPEAMTEEARQYGYRFPYLHDDSQTTAKAYRAACTPDFFLYDHDRRLVYRGRFDKARPSNSEPVTGEDLRRAIELVLAGEKVPEDQVPSMGCNIKWKDGNAPDYFG